jgi:hypothetical protein
MDFGYCPDCGQFIENQWFITRCACCGIKQKATIIKGEILPETNFCQNCGSENFVVEKIDKITPFDLYFAVLVKTEVNQRTMSFIQTWVEAREEKIHKFLTDKQKGFT